MYDVDHEALAAQDPTGRLYNPDLAPAKPGSRQWSSYSLFALSMNDAHNVGNYTFAAGLFLLGLSPIEVTLGILGGVLIIFGGCCMSGFMGQKTGAPYPVVSRMSWGIWGANVPALVRGIVAIGWYGIQTFLASIALKVVLVRFIPSLNSLTHTHVFGLDLLGWIAFLLLWVIQLAIVVRGMEAVIGNFWGLPVNWTMFAVTSVIVSAASVKVYGEAVLDPAELLQRIDNDVVVGGAVVFVLATIGVNIVANFVSASFDISNVAPRHISFKRGGIITAFLALLSTPWILYSSPQIIAYFLGTLGALLGPFFGVMAVDYFAIRKERFSIRHLYLPTRESIYYYNNGVNRLAVAAFVPAAIVSLTLALAPAFHLVAPFGWFVGAALGALFYLPLGKGRVPILPRDEAGRDGQTAVVNPVS